MNWEGRLLAALLGEAAVMGSSWTILVFNGEIITLSQVLEWEKKQAAEQQDADMVEARSVQP